MDEDMKLYPIKDNVTRLMKHADVGFAFCICFLIFLLIVPLTPLLLDFLLCVSLVFAVMTLLLVFFIEDALELSSFPSLLLILTLFRLGLNLSASRMILTRAEAGGVIHTFGDFVIQGNLIVGFVIFLLLTLINTMMITKGAGRIAEVAARFTLEALPGKQMAIDAQQSMHMISAQDAQIARDQVMKEAHFYGSMDGASKFVKGDALIGILMILVNLIGGISIGLTSHHYTLKESFEVFFHLTVGEALVAQIPSLILSLAAGILVTRVQKGSVSQTLPCQFFKHPKVFGLAGAILLLIGCVPGMPLGVILFLSCCLFIAAYGVYKKRKEEIFVQQLPCFRPFELQLGRGLLPLKETLSKEIFDVRRSFLNRLGFIVPTLQIDENPQLSNNKYIIKINGVLVVHSEEASVNQILSKVTEVIENHAYELLNLQNVALLVEKANAHNPGITGELFSNRFTERHLLKILQALLRDKIPILDMVTILEVLTDEIESNNTIEVESLAESVRKKLTRTISHHFVGKEKQVDAIILDPKVDQMLAVSGVKTSYDTKMMLRPQTIEKIVNSLSHYVQEAEKRGMTPIVLTSVHSRKNLQRLIEKKLPHLPVLSTQDLLADVEIRHFKTVSQDVLI